MNYKMFIDDERFPPEDGADWKICRNHADVIHTMVDHGWPQFVSFDHDLGENEPTGMDIAWWFVDLDLQENTMPRDFAFYVHSQNPIGAENIRSLLNGYLAQR